MTLIKKFYFIFLIVFCTLATRSEESKLDKDVWIAELRKNGVQNFIVCGSDKINATGKTLSEEFLLGPEQAGYIISNMLSSVEYFEIVSHKNLNPAKLEIQNFIRQAHLWKYTKKQGLQDLGSPSKIELLFTATIKDCMEGAKTTLGKSCTNREGNIEKSCCSEKFQGPTVFWGDNHSYQLLPDYQIKIPGEKKYRYCLANQKLKTNP